MNIFLAHKILQDGGFPKNLMGSVLCGTKTNLYPKMVISGPLSTFAYVLGNPISVPLLFSQQLPRDIILDGELW